MKVTAVLAAVSFALGGALLAGCERDPGAPGAGGTGATGTPGKAQPGAPADRQNATKPMPGGGGTGTTK